MTTRAQRSLISFFVRRYDRKTFLDYFSKDLKKNGEYGNLVTFITWRRIFRNFLRYFISKRQRRSNCYYSQDFYEKKKLEKEKNGTSLACEV